MKNKFRELVKKRNKIFATLGLIQWDLETKTPKKSKAYLSELIGDFSMQEYEIFTYRKLKKEKSNYQWKK